MKTTLIRQLIVALAKEHVTVSDESIGGWKALHFKRCPVCDLIQKATDYYLGGKL